MSDAAETMTAEEFNALHARKASSERRQQEALVKWAAAKAAERPALRLLFHVPNGGHRKAQRWWRENLRRVGHAHAVCRSWIEAKTALERYLDGTFKLDAP